MDLIGNFIMGFGVALTPANLMFCFIGALIGTLIGVLPGIGPVATLAILLPVTFYLPPIWGWMALRWLQRHSYLRTCATSAVLAPARAPSSLRLRMLALSLMLAPALGCRCRRIMRA